MPYNPTQGKTAVALFVDGLEMKYAQLSLTAGNIVVRDIKTVSLVKKLEEKKVAAATEEMGFGDGGTDSFAEAGPVATPEVPGGANNATILMGLITDIPSTKFSFSYGISEPSVAYHEFESDWGLKGNVLKKRVMTELSASRQAPLKLDAIEIIPTATGGLNAVIREEGLMLYDLLQEIKPFYGQPLPNIKVIESSDTALMSLFRMSGDFGPEEISVLIYVGNEFSRLIFMQGNEFLHFAPIMSEGYNSTNIDDTIYRRLLLEQDSAGVSRIDRIILAGEGRKVNLQQSLVVQFPDLHIDYLRVPDINTSLFGEEGGEIVSEYAVPISIALSALRPAFKGSYDINLLPDEIVEAQKAFKLAWHGWLVALLSVGSIVFFITQIQNQAAEIRSRGLELRARENELRDLVNLQVRTVRLNDSIRIYQSATALYDSIAPGSDRWSRVLHYLSNSVEDLNSLWITSIMPDKDNPKILSITGRAIYRSRIPRLVRLFESARLKSVKMSAVRGKVLYDFEIIVERVDLSDPVLKSTK
jgi:hypothetical protein